MYKVVHAKTVGVMVLVICPKKVSITNPPSSKNVKNFDEKNIIQDKFCSIRKNLFIISDRFKEFKKI
jgi:hypothetical protein